MCLLGSLRTLWYSRNLSKFHGFSEKGAPISQDFTYENTENNEFSQTF